ncbi:FAD dependent oxidoreductase-domain-containing protein [Triangularia setosa]|uniref:FAD dependent oxidoreductase-domain-containing protein n=1 Tax=Triangularia setosa TaxID=2587417 RepID=A0AAN6WCC3_9PEZI|nr:FAD dependent oxidoreductase-domain-containing protein [Podospora setosa]
MTSDTGPKTNQAGLPSANPTPSYWLRDLDPLLVGHRTTPDLPEEADIVIVGSGITGAFAARFLLQDYAPNKKLVMLEAREACGGATGRNGGHCQPLVYGTNPAVAAFELETFSFLEKLVKDENVDCDWITLSGGVHAFLSTPLFQTAVNQVNSLSQTHPTLAAQLQVVHPTAPPSQLAHLKVPHCRGAIVQKTAASLWPYKLISHVLCSLLTKQNFNLQTHTPVLCLAPSRSPSSPGKWQVSTPRGVIITSQILLATNGYTSHLLPSFSDLILPVRGQIAAIVPPSPIQTLKYSYLFAADPEQGQHAPRDDYLVQRPVLGPAAGGGEAIYGGGRRLASRLGLGEYRDDEVEPAVARYLRENLSPPLNLGCEDGELPSRYEWTGVMGYSRDANAWVGEVPSHKGIWVCAGYTGHGMPSAALSARAVAAQMLGLPETGEGHAKLPDEFKITEERINRARQGPKLEDCGGWEGAYFSGLTNVE